MPSGSGCSGSAVVRAGAICRHHRNDPIVGKVDEIVQIARRDRPEYGQLGRRILFAEHVQRPVVDCRASKMRVVEVAAKVSVEHEQCSFRPLQIDLDFRVGSDHPRKSIGAGMDLVQTAAVTFQAQFTAMDVRRRIENNGEYEQTVK
jgi:hypothetical protein